MSKKPKYKREELLRVALHIYEHIDPCETNGEIRAIQVTEAADWLLRSVDATMAGKATAASTTTRSLMVLAPAIRYRPLDEDEDNDDA